MAGSGAKNFVFNLLVDSSKGEADLNGFAAFAQTAAAGVATAWATSQISDAINANFDVAEGQARLAAQLGSMPAETAALGSVAGEVWSKGFTGEMEQVNEGVAAVTRNIGDLGELGADQMGDLTTKALGLSDVFGQDITRVTAAVGKILKNDLAPDADAAFDVITAGLQGNTNEADDLLDTFIEYSTQFRQLGIDAPTALGLMSQGLAGGARNADVVADSLKEFAIRAQEAMSTPIDTGAIRAAQQGVADAHRSASQAVAAAARNTASAEERLTQAQRTQRDAQRDLTQARKDAKAALAELEDQITGAALSERGAAMAVERARRARDEALAATGEDYDQLAVDEAQLAYEQAIFNLEEQGERTAELKREKAAADRAGIDGSKQVKGAQDQVTESAKGVKDAQTALKEAQQAARDAQVDGARAIAEANATLADVSTPKLTSLGEAYRKLGLDGESIGAMVAAGGDSAKAALQIVLDALDGVEDPATRAQIAVEIFGTKSEDMAGALDSLDPSSATSKLGALAGVTDKAIESMGDNPRAKVEEMRRGLSNFTTSLINTNGPLGDAVTGFMAFGPAALEMATAVGPLLAVTAARAAMVAPTAAATGANVGFAASMWAATWPVLAVIGGLALLGLGIYELVTHFDDVKAWFGDNWPQMLQIIAGPFGLAWKLISENWGSIKAGATDAKNWVGDRIGDITGFVQDIPDAIGGAVEWFGDGLEGMVHKTATAIAWLWNHSIGAIGFSVPNWVPGIGGNSFSVPDIRVPALAEGGVALGPTLALIGEAGPEAVVPLSQAGRYGVGGDMTVPVEVVVKLDGRVILRALERIILRRGA